MEISRDIDSEITERINNLEKEIKNIKNILRNTKTKNMGKQGIDIGVLNERVDNIENHIYRRRNPFMAKGQQKKDS